MALSTAPGFLWTRPSSKAEGKGGDGAPAVLSKSEILFRWMLCLIAASIPNENVLGGYDARTGEGMRSPTFYLVLATTLLTPVMLPKIVRTLTRSLALVLAFTTHGIGLLVLSAMVLAQQTTFTNTANLDRPFKVLFMSLLVATAADSALWRRRIVVSYLTGWVCFTLYALFLLFTGQAVTAKHLEGATRISVLGMNANVQSVIAGTGTLLVMSEMMRARTLGARVLLASGILLGASVFILGSSRTAIIALIAGIVVLVVAWAWDRSGGGTSALLTFGGIAALIGFAILVSLDINLPFADALVSITIRTESAIDGGDLGQRDVLAAECIDVALNNPMGIGLARVQRVLGLDPHNGYLKLWAECGILGVAVFVAAVVVASRRAKLLASDPAERGIVACFAMLTVCASFGQTLVEFPYWLIFGLVATPSVAFMTPPPASPRDTSRREGASTPRRK